MTRFAACLIASCVLLGIGTVSGASLEIYGTIHSMGVIVDLAPGDDPDENALATVQYRIHGGGALWRGGHPLSRVDLLRFTGSLFNLDPSTDYDVRITFDDPGGILHGTSLEMTGPTRDDVSVPDPIANFYASPDGSGSVCTEENPCALSEALNMAQPGDAVVLRNGIYFTGGIIPPRSGSAAAPVIIRAYPGETPVFDGADPGTFAWTAAGNGVYETTLGTGDTHLVIVDNERIYPYQSLEDLENLVWGLSGFYCDGTALSVKLLDGTSAATHAVVISRFNHAFYVDDRDYLVFDGLTFRHYGCGSYAKAMYLNNANDNTIQNCTFTVNDLGIGIKRTSHRNVIQSCQFRDTIFDWPWDAVKTGSQLETGGIRFYSPCDGRGTIIRYNTFCDYFDGFGVYPESAGADTNETDVYENIAWDIGDDCIETDGTCANVRIWNNTFSNCLVGISLAPVYDGPVYAIRNLISGTGAGNNSYPGSPFKFNSGYGQSGPMYLYHNTADAVLPGSHGLDIKAPGTWVLITARNNIWRGTDYGMRDYNTANPVDLDYNCISTTGGPTLVRWDSTNYSTLVDFTAATGQELHGFDLMPVFANPSVLDYSLVPGSPLIDAGVIIPGINDDYEGTAPDVGAFENSACVHDGDTNRDGILTAGDAQLAFLITLGAYSPSFEEACAADCNGNGDVTAGDAQLIFLSVLGAGECVDPL
ncbi:MAG TPA: right-handed parallel beta-helix repeat-containing protein [bacterium]|nr:right-handed parallel beta-helix repeat-containing protein [bacterium]